MALGQAKIFNRSLERALQILGAFSFEIGELTLAELSIKLNLSKSTVYRLASTLSNYDFLHYNETEKKYSLGSKLFELGGIFAASLSIRKSASPHLDNLYSQIGKTVFLATFQEDEVVYIDKREDLRNPIRFSSEIGRRRPPYFGMFGQLFMAFLPDTEVDRILKTNPLQPSTKKSITTKKLFKARLREIRRQAFCIDKGEAIDGVTGIAAPITNHNGKVVAAVGLSFISSSVDSKGLLKIRKAICEIAKRISQDLGSPRDNEFMNDF
jgi:IclR family transcriptional regulator, KDG regulon repressor